MKVVSRLDPEITFNLRREVLDALPRTTHIDGIDLLRKVKDSVRKKIESEHETITAKEIGDKFIGSILGNLAKWELYEKLNYDGIMRVLEALVLENKVSREDGELPTFQRID